MLSASKRRFARAAPTTVPRLRPHTDLVLRLHDGRRIGVAEFGTRAPLPVIYCHGFLGSRLEPATAERLEANIIAFDRPGYGNSDPQRLPSLRGWAADIGEALVQLGVGEFMAVGVSSGAPYALSLAATLGPRVRRVILTGGVAGPEVLETAGGTALALSLLGRGSRAGRLLHQMLRLALVTRLDRRLLALAIGTERSALLRQGMAVEELHARMLESLRTGSPRHLRGALADAQLLAQPWDFTLAEVGAEVLVLHGAADPVVPPTHGHWYAAHLPHARLEILPGELHLSLCFRSAHLVQKAVRELAETGADTERPPDPAAYGAARVDRP